MATGTTANKKEADKFKDLCGPTDPKLDREVREKLITARVGLLLRASFFGNLATRPAPSHLYPKAEAGVPFQGVHKSVLGKGE